MSFQLDPATTMGTVALKVSNIERSIAFYEKVIGLRAISVTDHQASLSANGKDVLLELEEVSEPYTGTHRGHTGLYHFALLLPTRKALGNILKHFIQLKISVGQADHLVSEALYLSDPDQNGIEIYRDRPRSEWQYDSNNMVRMSTDPIDWEGVLAEADERPFTTLDNDTVMGHIHLHVSDLNTAYRYYCELLGFSLESDWSANGALFIGAGRYHHHIGLNIWNGRGGTPLPSHATGIKEYTIHLGTDEERETIAERLKQARYQVDARGKQYYTIDPFGIGIVLN